MGVLHGAQEDAAGAIEVGIVAHGDEPVGCSLGIGSRHLPSDAFGGFGAGIFGEVLGPFACRFQIIASPLSVNSGLA